MSGLFLWKKASKYSQEYIVSSCLKQDEVPGNGFFSYLRFRKSPWTPAFRLFDFPPFPSLSSVWRMDFLLCVLIWISCHVCLSVDSCHICLSVDSCHVCLSVDSCHVCLSVDSCHVCLSVDSCHVCLSVDSCHVCLSVDSCHVCLSVDSCHVCLSVDSCHVCLSVDSCYICWFVNLFTGLDFWLCLLVSGFLQCLSVVEFCCIDWSVDLCYVYWSGFPVVFACGFLRCV